MAANGRREDARQQVEPGTARRRPVEPGTARRQPVEPGTARRQQVGAGSACPDIKGGLNVMRGLVFCEKRCYTVNAVWQNAAIE